MKYCQECGKMNADAALFCVGCGSPFGDVEIPYTEPEQDTEATTESEAPTFDDFVTYVPVYDEEASDDAMSEEPEAEPVYEETYTEPEVEQAYEETYAEPESELVYDEAQVEETSAEPVYEEVYTEPEPEPVYDEVQEEEIPVEPVYEEETVEPVNEEATAEPVYEEAYTEPETEPVYEEVYTEPEAEQVYEETYTEPETEQVYEETYTEPEPEPVYDEVQEEEIPVEPVYEEEPVEPVNEEATAEPVYEEVYTEPEAEPVYEEEYTEPEAEPVYEETYTEPETEQVYEETYAEPELEPVYDEVQVEETSAEPEYEEEPVEPIYEEAVAEPEPEYVDLYGEPEAEPAYEEVPADETPADPEFEEIPAEEVPEEPTYEEAPSMFAPRMAKTEETSAEEQMLTPQELFGEDYSEIVAIGGNYGMAYKAFSKSANMRVVIKKVHSQIENLANITDTINRMKRVKHKNLPQVIDYIQTNGNIYSVMEFIEGKSLYQYIKGGQKFSEKQIAEWADQVSSAMGYLHEFEPQVIHADIKPSNIIIKPDNTIVLTDYNPETIDKYGAHVIGYSEGYAPPEQYEFRSANTYSATNYDEKYAKTVSTGADGIYTAQEGTTCEAATRAFASVDERSDIYNFGATFYFALTGKRPEASTGEVTAINKAGAKVSSSFAAIINKCMEKDPKKRYQKADELIAAIKRYKRRPIIIIAAFALILILAILIIVVPMLKKKSKGPMENPNGQGMPAPSTSVTSTPAVTDGDITEAPETTDVVTPVDETTPTDEIKPTEDIVTETPVPTEDEQPSITPEVTEEPSPIETPSPTEELTATPEPSVTEAPSPTGSVTPTVTATPTVSPTPKATPTEAEASATPKPTKKPKPTEKPTAEATPTPSISKSTYYSNLIGFELGDGTLKNYNLAKSLAFDGLKPTKVKYVYFGGYPSTLVTSENTLDNLKKQTPDSKGIIVYGGTKYLKVDYMQSNAVTATLYYRYAPVKWQVLKATKDEIKLISDQVIDFYEYSELSGWLSSVFKNGAFSGTEKNIISSSVTFLSASDVASYSGMNMKPSVTDYAAMRKNFGKNKYDSYVLGMWWLNAGSVSKAPYVDGTGSVMTNGLDATTRQGIRPVITITIQ